MKLVPTKNCNLKGSKVSDLLFEVYVCKSRNIRFLTKSIKQHTSIHTSIKLKI